MSLGRFIEAPAPRAAAPKRTATKASAKSAAKKNKKQLQEEKDKESERQKLKYLLLKAPDKVKEFYKNNPDVRMQMQEEMRLVKKGDWSNVEAIMTAEETKTRCTTTMAVSRLICKFG